jgi:excisionase family DNA binding protein
VLQPLPVGELAAAGPGPLPAVPRAAGLVLPPQKRGVPVVWYENAGALNPMLYCLYGPPWRETPPAFPSAGHVVMPRSLNSTEASALLRVNRKTLLAWVRAGRVRAVRVGHRWLFPEQELAQLLTSCQPAAAG